MITDSNVALIFMLTHILARDEQCCHAKENLASAKIVKIEFNADLDLIRFSPICNI